MHKLNGYYLTDDYYDKTVRLVARTLLEHIIHHPTRNRLPIFYKDLSVMLEGAVYYRNLDQYLISLSEICKVNKLPLASACVISQKEGRPENVFFKKFYPGMKKDEWDITFYQCLDQIAQFEQWEKFAEIFDESNLM